MNLKRYILWVLAWMPLLLISESCQKDFLDKKPLNSFSSEDVWSDISLVQLYVNSIYQVLPHFRGGPSETPSSSGLSGASSEGYATFDYEDVWFWNSGTVSPDNLSMDGWEDYYRFVRRCNIFFQHIESVEGDQELKDQLTGQVTFLRAWCYFALWARYGGVPLVTQVYNLTDSSFVVARNSYDECLQFIVDELDKAVNLLPPSYTGDDIGRVTKGAALALKSRALLYAASTLNNPSHDLQKWQAAADAAKALIDLADEGTYALYQGDYTQIFLEDHNSEVILAYGMNSSINPYYGDYGSMLNVQIGPNGYHGWSAYVPSQNMVDQFEMKNGKSIDEDGSNYDRAHPYDDRDPRFYADILYNGAEFRGRKYESFEGGLDSPQSPIENWNASLTGYNWRKYANESEPISENLGTDQNWIIFRLAEVYLNYAESECELGHYDEARKYLNLIRGRTSVNMPAVNTSGTDLLEDIRHERMVELCLEGHRFFDVRRWKIAEQTENKPLQGVHITKQADGSFTYSYFTLQEREFNPSNYLFPIPKYELDKNNLLEQNPGYQ